MSKNVRKIINVSLSILLGGAILYWMYRGFDFKSMEHVLMNEMNWWWMIASLPFGVLAQMFRGWRWKQTLEPLGEKPRMSNCLNSIFLSYAASLVIPRIGEFTRCGILAKKDGVSFPKALGTVVTERAVDSLIVLVITLVVLLMQMPVFLTFFSKTGTRLDDFMGLFGMFSTMGYVVTAICGMAALISIYLVRKRLAFYNKVKATVQGIYDGVMSLRSVKNVPLFIFYSIAIWASYFIHYYLTFFCFEATAGLGLTCALVTFIVGSIAVLVPTPNGAGSWHFAVKTMMILYGVADASALFFVLIVHSLQTLLVALLGVYAWVAITLTPERKG
ncbi:MAG: flippase-like domain-containing protein [Prevotella sp.]|nr:flippase-like domain-containing protein [Candidatus Prevotella equi]